MPRLVRSGEIWRGKLFMMVFSDLIGKIEAVVWRFGLSCFSRFQLKHYAYIKSSLIYRSRFFVCESSQLSQSSMFCVHLNSHAIFLIVIKRDVFKQSENQNDCKASNNI